MTKEKLNKYIEELKQKENEVFSLNESIKFQQKVNEQILEENENILKTIEEFKNRNKKLEDERKSKMYDYGINAKDKISMDHFINEYLNDKQKERFNSVVKINIDKIYNRIYKDFDNGVSREHTDDETGKEKKYPSNLVILRQLADIFNVVKTPGIDNLMKNIATKLAIYNKRGERKEIPEYNTVNSRYNDTTFFFFFSRNNNLFLYRNSRSPVNSSNS